MKYIIDANNLAGSLGLLSQKNFDLELIQRIRDFFSKKNIEVSLVFDSSDPLGDRRREDGVEVIYTPRDSYYRGADDKILELIKARPSKKEIVLVTNDLELTKKAKEIPEKDLGAGFEVMKADRFGRKMNSKKKDHQKEDIELTTWSKEKTKEINQELLEQFKQDNNKTNADSS